MINGVEVKSLNTFRGHEGEECWQGNVYLNGKKLGFWSQDSWGGCDTFDFDEALLDEACLKYSEGFPDNYRYKEVCAEKEVFLHAVASLKTIQKDLVKGFKKGFKSAILVTDGFHTAWTWFDDDGKDEELLKKYSSHVEKMKKDMFKDGYTITVFRPDSFDMIIDKEHPAPQFFITK